MMNKLLIEKVKVSAAGSGMACGPVGGAEVVEVRIRNILRNTVTFYSLAMVDGTLNFFESKESTFDLQMNLASATDADLQKVRDCSTGGYMDAADFLSDVEKLIAKGDEQAMIRKYLFCLLRAGAAEAEHLKALGLGKHIGEFPLPDVCIDDEADDDE